MGHERPGELALQRRLEDSVAQLVDAVDVAAHAEVDDGVHTRDEGERRSKDLVSGTDAEQPQPEVNRRSTARKRDRRGACQAGELLFESLEVGAYGAQPVALERLLDERPFVPFHVRDR